jgi:hypothetical protein
MCKLDTIPDVAYLTRNTDLGRRVSRLGRVPWLRAYQTV